jgi:hypothetical protein
MDLRARSIARYESEGIHEVPTGSNLTGMWLLYVPYPELAEAAGFVKKMLEHPINGDCGVDLMYSAIIHLENGGRFRNGMKVIDG